MPADDEAKINLRLDIFGLDNAKELESELGKINEQIKGGLNPTEQAQAALLETSNVTDRLKEAVQRAKDQLAGLGDEFKAGLISEDAYIERTDVLIDVLRQKEQVLDRLGGEDTGFGQLGKQVFQAERALNALATGSGIGRLGPMLESLIGGAGGPAGIGFGIAGLAFLLETIVPKVERFLSAFDTDQMQTANDRLDALVEKVQKLQALKGDEAGAAVTNYLKGSGVDIQGMTAGALGVSGLGEQATEEEKAAMSGNIAPIQGMDAAGYRQLQEDAKKRVAARIQKANVRKAAEWIDQAQEPGERGKEARAILRRLAGDNPARSPRSSASFSRTSRKARRIAARLNRPSRTRIPTSNFCCGTRKHAIPATRRLRNTTRT